MCWTAICVGKYVCFNVICVCETSACVKLLFWVIMTKLGYQKCVICNETWWFIRAFVGRLKFLVAYLLCMTLIVGLYFLIGKTAHAWVMCGIHHDYLLYDTCTNAVSHMPVTVCCIIYNYTVMLHYMQWPSEIHFCPRQTKLAPFRKILKSNKRILHFQIYAMWQNGAPFQSAF